MAQIIPFPGTIRPQMPALAPPRRPKDRGPIDTPKVVKIRRFGRMPKANRPEDAEAIMFARLSQGWADRAYELAQTEPDSEAHRTALHMAGIDHKLPRNNLRIFTTPEDVVRGIFEAWRLVNIADLEWQLCDAHRCVASRSGDEDERKRLERMTDEADAKRWQQYERLIRIPASQFSDFSYKVKHWPRGMGNLEWMRTYKPAFAAILDDELARLDAEKAARKAAREAKRKGGAA